MVVALGSKKRSMLLVHSIHRWPAGRPAGHHRVVGRQISSIDKSSGSRACSKETHTSRLRRIIAAGPISTDRRPMMTRPSRASPAGAAVDRSIGRCPYSSQASTASEQRPRQRHSAHPAPGGVVPLRAAATSPRHCADDRIASHSLAPNPGRGGPSTQASRYDNGWGRPCARACLPLSERASPSGSLPSPYSSWPLARVSTERARRLSAVAVAGRAQGHDGR
jgi:hypothetical protein